MRVALVSSEFLGTAQSGGIGTYMRMVADMLANRGHDVEVFTTGLTNETSIDSTGIRINAVVCPSRGEFPQAIAPVVGERHRARAFDVAEGAEFLAETAEVARLLPNLPLVLKLHTPGVLIKEIDRAAIPWTAKLRFMLGGFLRGRINKPFWTYDRASDYEWANLATADEVTSPCQAMVERLGDLWGLDPATIPIIPNVFTPADDLLAVPAVTNTRTITFIGRLEFRKGVLSLVQIIPKVLRQVPDAKFRLVGRAMPHPNLKVGLDEVIREQLAAHSGSIEWIPGARYDEVLRYYASTDICLFPSMWENFPNVVLEAMSAARGIVASSAGGMAEMIRHGESGLLAAPNDPDGFAEAIVAQLQSPERRIEMGEAARERVLSAFSVDAVAPLQEASYARAIKQSSEKQAGIKNNIRKC